jgi:hypothetical protein
MNSQKRARQAANVHLRMYHAHWLRSFEEDNERFCEQVMRFAQADRDVSPNTAPAE